MGSPKNKDAPAAPQKLAVSMAWLAHASASPVPIYLAHSLGGDPSWSAVGGFVLMFLAMWWVWIGSTYYNDRYETDDLAHRIFTFLIMVGVAGMESRLDHQDPSHRPSSLSLVRLHVSCGVSRRLTTGTSSAAPGSMAP